MTKTDPIIAVKNIKTSSEWYESVFECTNKHGGGDFAVLVSKDKEVLICLHKWNEHEHPTMKNPNITPGNGLILYFRTENIDLIRENLKKLQYPVEKEIHQNLNSTKMEFSVRDPDGYYLTITEFHKYEG